jgi:very-short-patch-repair endonuclease
MIELDGSVHDGQIEADAQRDKVLKAMRLGLRTCAEPVEALSVSRITRPREFIHCVGEN